MEEWNKALVLPIFKFEYRQKYQNFRPISILPIISKIFERSVFNQLYEFLDENSLLSKYKTGFRPKELDHSIIHLFKCLMHGTQVWITAV